MPSDQIEFEIFISYARLDNRPIPESYPHGWVTALRDQILADQRRYSTERLRIFFDTAEIKDMDDWRERILGGLRSSKILLICLSPNYFKSEPCRWEWEEYLKRQIQQLMGFDTIATVYFVEVPGADEQENAERLTELMRGNYTDLRPWFPAGPRMLQEEEVKRRIDALGLSLWERVERARRARDVPGNVRRTNPFFVGRREELRRLHEQLGVGAIGVVTAVHGLGGQGKTELAYHYANGYADSFQGGLWSLAAEGKKELVSLLGELAFVPQFEYTPSDAEKADAFRLGQAVLEVLRKRCELKGAGVALVILDNVSEPELLGVAQLANLPHPANWLRLVATTRLGPERLAKSGKQLVTVPIDSLTPEDALTLIRDHQPDQRFANAVQESAAREIVRELGGFTLAVEQAAIYLGLSGAAETPSEFLKRLRAEGLPSADGIPTDADAAAQILHQQKQLGPILRAAVTQLVGELPAAETTLQYAALLPPDSVPWPWLQKLTTERRPVLADRPVEWGRIKRRLDGMRLLTSGDAPEIARMHRLVAAHLLKDVGELRAQELLSFVAERASALKPRDADAWEIDALTKAIPFLLGRFWHRQLAVLGLVFADEITDYRSLAVVKALLEDIHSFLYRVAKSGPDDDEAQFVLWLSLTKLGQLVLKQGDLPEAHRHATECLRIAQGMVEADADYVPGEIGVPASSGRANHLNHLLAASYEMLGDLAAKSGNLVEARALVGHALHLNQRRSDDDVAGTLVRLGDLAIAQGNLAEAQQHFNDAYVIFRRLAEDDPKHEPSQQDLYAMLGKRSELAVKRGNHAEAQRLIEECYRIVLRLAEADPSNTQWQRDLASTFSNLGRQAVAQNKLSEAKRCFSDGYRILLRLTKIDPLNTEWQRDLSVILRDCGDVAMAHGTLAEAQQFFADSLKIILGMVEKDPAIGSWQWGLSTTYSSLSKWNAAQGNLAEAERLATQSYRIRQRIVHSDETNKLWQRDLAASLDVLADLTSAQGNLSQAKEFLTEALGVVQRLADADPQNAEWQRDVSVTLTRLGDLASAQGNLPEAEKTYVESHRILLHLTEPDWAEPRLRRDLAAILQRLGNLVEAQGNLTEARRFFADALSAIQRVAQEEPANIEVQHDLAVSLFKLADSDAHLGNVPEALRAYTQCLAISERLVDFAPANTERQSFVGLVNGRLGSLAWSQGDAENAEKYWTAKVRIIERLAKNDTNNAKWQLDWSGSLTQLGNLALAKGNLADAERHFTDSRRILQALTLSDPENADWQHDLSRLLQQLGDLSAAQGKLPEARQHFTERLRIAQSLADLDPVNNEWQSDLSLALEKLGELLLTLRNLPEGERLLSESHRIRQQLATLDPSNPSWQRDLSVALEKLAKVSIEKRELPKALVFLEQALAIIEKLLVDYRHFVLIVRSEWVLHIQIANVLDTQRNANAMAHWRKAHALLAAMVDSGLHVSLQDLFVLKQIRAKFGW